VSQYAVFCRKEQTFRYYLNNAMEQNPSWEANSFRAGQEIFCILCNPNGHYQVYTIPPLVFI